MKLFYAHFANEQTWLTEEKGLAYGYKVNEWQLEEL